MLNKVVMLDWVTVHCKPLGEEIDYTAPGYEVKRIERGTRTCAVWEEVSKANRRIATINREPYSSVMDKKSVWVKFDNWMLYRYNFFDEMKLLLDMWGLQFIGYSRVDFALDYQELDNGEAPVELVKNFLSGTYLKIGKGKFGNNGSLVPVGYEEAGSSEGESYCAQGNYHFTYEPQYLRFGSPKNPDMICYTYNKRKELADVSDKPWIRLKWKENDEDPEKPVWRLEFSIRAKCVKFLDKDTAEELDTHNIDLISPIHRNQVFSALLLKYWQFCRADHPDINKARRPRVPVLSLGATPFRIYTNCVETESNRMEKIMIKKLKTMYDDMRGMDRDGRGEIKSVSHSMIVEHGLQDWVSSRGYFCNDDTPTPKFDDLMKLPKRGTEKIIHMDGDTDDAVEVITETIKESSEMPFIKQLARSLYEQTEGRSEMLPMLLSFAYKTAYFEGNAANWQRVRSAIRTVEDGRANCVDYTVLICSICKALPYDPDIRFRIVTYDGEHFTHIFPVIGGKILDCVPEQEQEYGVEAVKRKFPSRVSFNHTLPYVSHREFQL